MLLDIEAIRATVPRIALDDHWQLLEAVKMRDATLARDRLIYHFSHVEKRITAAITD